jgi:hypothetical protein
MPRRVSKPVRGARLLLSSLVFAAPSIVACSFFAPSLDEYARARGGAGGGAGAGAGAGSDSAGTGATLAGNGGNMSAAGLGGGPGGEGGAEAGASSEAGWAGEPMIGQTVTQADTKLDQVVTRGLPVFGALTSYGSDEATAAQTDPPRDTPNYQPYDSSAAAWWDNLVAEELQARVAVVLFPTHGAFSTDASDLTGPDAMNPRRLSAWLSALSRAAATQLFEAGCFVDMPSVQAVSNHVDGNPAGTLMDLSKQSEWNNVVWMLAIKPWFDTIPAANWYVLNANPDSSNKNPLIEFGSLSTSSFSNAAGNLSTQLTALASSFHDAYGTFPNFVLDSTWFAIEPALTSNRYVIGKNDLITEGPASVADTTYQGLTIGSAVPGFSDPAYYQVGNARYHDSTLLIPRHTKDAYGTPVTTLVTGLSSGVQNQAQLTVLQDFASVDQWSGFYRSGNADWLYPNEYLNLVRRYSDPKTRSLRLEAEGCDSYSDTTPGNSGGAFLRSGDLDVRTLDASSGWAVTNTAPGEWIEFSNVDFSAGTYKFAAKYATSGASSAPKRIQLIIDGARLTPIIATNTVDANSFSTTLLAEQFMAHGPHTLRVRFIDGLVDLDWIFTRKTDSTLSLQIAGGTFASALEGGGTTVVTNASSAAIFEQFTFDDLNGGTLADGDQVYVQTYNGLYLSVVGGVLTAAARTPGTPETFIVHSVSGGDITQGSTLALATADGKNYVTVGAGNVLDGTGTSIRASQTFTVGTY